jgi:hypothetical protein
MRPVHSIGGLLRAVWPAMTAGTVGGDSERTCDVSLFILDEIGLLDGLGHEERGVVSMTGSAQPSAIISDPMSLPTSYKHPSLK